MSAVELAPPASVDIAVTHRCVPRIGHLCWQYDPAAKAMPSWVTAWTTTQIDGRLEFCDRDCSTGVYLDPGDWLVQFAEDSDYAAVYSAADFAEQFQLVFQ